MAVYIIGFLIILIIITGLIWLSFWLPKKLGYPKFGKYLSIIVGTIIGFYVLSGIFEDELFSKKNATELLAEQNVKLNDEFELNENKSMSSIGDYYHTFTLKISEKDKARIINEIKELEIDFSDAAKDFTVNSNDLILNIKIHLDAFKATLTELANKNLLLDRDGDGIIEISTDDDDGHHAFGEQIKLLLENETHLDDKD